MNGFRSSFLLLGPAAASKPQSHGENLHDQGFTLVELLVVIGIIAILTTTLLPALAASKVSTKADQCMANTRQLELGWAMYASDNRQNFVYSGPGVNGWVQGYMDWTSNPDNTNTTLLVGPTPTGQPAPALATYLKNPRVFKDPADNYQSAANPGPRIRSYSMNGALGSGIGPNVQGTAPGNRKYYGNDPYHISLGRSAVQSSDLIHPSLVYVFLDEQADSINDAKYQFNPGGGITQPGPEKWRDLPASYHNKAGCFSFADGHSIIHRWQDPRTVWPVTYTNTASSLSAWGKNPLVVSPDYEWMDDHMPYR